MSLQNIESIGNNKELSLVLASNGKTSDYDGTERLWWLDLVVDLGVGKEKDEKKDWSVL